jgi:FlaA1/EpsC-like NDP-sugar epimerase
MRGFILAGAPFQAGGRIGAVRVMQGLSCVPMRLIQTPRSLAVDSTVWALALLVATWARFDFHLAMVDIGGWVTVALLASVVNGVVGCAFGVYRHRYVPGSFEESVALAMTAAISAGALMVPVAVTVPHLVPRSVPMLGGAFALGGVLAVRWFGRVRARHRRRATGQCRNVVVYGAGRAGQSLVRRMEFADRIPYRVVALLDDDPEKRHLRVGSVHVCGRRCDLASVAARFKAEAVVIAMTDPGPELVRDVSGEAALLGIGALITPPVSQVVRSARPAGDVRDLRLDDLLGRPQAHLDEEAMARPIAGRRVLVTGAGGSIGSEICRQLHRLGPAELVMLDRDESALHAAQLSIYGRALLDRGDTVLADIRDANGIRRIFDSCLPEVVFHAAALKHLPLLESYPLEAWMTNIVGTWNVLSAARAVDVQAFVNISTDKAANPISVLGYSKRVTERLTAYVGSCGGGRFLSVRFGNVLGSRGSVLEAFARQIEEGGPVTVTHPDVTRYFMTIPEACQLVLESAVIGTSGETLVLDMGRPASIADIARRLVQRAERDDIEIVYTGLRRGEKLHEELFGIGEVPDYRPFHPLVSHVVTPPLALHDGEARLDRFADHDGARCWMAREAGATIPMPATFADLEQTVLPGGRLVGGVST